MKMPALVLAVLFAASGAAFAGDSAAKHKVPEAAQSVLREKPVLDHRATGSVQRVGTAEPTLDHAADKALTVTGKRLGMDVSPWMMPFAH